MEAFRISCFYNRHAYDQSFDESGMAYSRTLLATAIKKNKKFVISELQRTLMQVIDGIQLAIYFRVLHLIFLISEYLSILVVCTRQGNFRYFHVRHGQSTA